MARRTPFRVGLRIRPASLARVGYVTLCLLICSAPAHAEKADREKNIEFQGDTGHGQ